MIRYKVFRASKILLVVSVVVLAVAITLLVLRTDFFNTGIHSTASLVYEDTAKTLEVFAVSSDSGNKLSSTPLTNGSGISFEVLDTDQPDSDIPLPRIFIYHTHTREAYAQDPNDPYMETEKWRTTDPSQNVIRVGEELANILREMGFVVIHDKTDHEQTDLSTAYERSLITLEALNDPFDIYIDLHRDAYSDGLQLRHIDASGQASAQIMVLIGNGEGFDVKPAYAENRIFAKKLTQRINRIKPEICRDVLVKDGRYNQHIGVFSVLIEIGHNLNTLEEALNAVPVLAEGIYDLLVREPDLQISSILHEIGR